LQKVASLDTIHAPSVFLSFFPDGFMIPRASSALGIFYSKVAKRIKYCYDNGVHRFKGKPWDTSPRGEHFIVEAP
jgi:hypothetical protein